MIVPVAWSAAVLLSLAAVKHGPAASARIDIGSRGERRYQLATHSSIHGRAGGLTCTP